jgi:hypothetical protein
MSLDDLYIKAKEENTFIMGKCVVGQWAALLLESDHKAFEDSLNDEDFTTRSLHTLYKNAGATFGLTSLKEHRNGNCLCR